MRRWRSHFILVARTSDDPRRGLSAFLYHKDAPGWRIVRRIAIMGPEEHGGVCELEFDGLEIPEEHRLLEEGDGLRLTQIRLGPARLTHCMRWLGLAKRSMEIAQAYVKERKAFGSTLAERESVQLMLGEVAAEIEKGRLLTMHAAWKLDQGSKAQKEVSMAKIHVADTLEPRGGRGRAAVRGARAIPRTQCSNGSTAMPVAPSWWTVPRKSTRWCWPAASPRKATTSGVGARGAAAKPRRGLRRVAAFG